MRFYTVLTAVLLLCWALLMGFILLDAPEIPGASARGVEVFYDAQRDP